MPQYLVQRYTLLGTQLLRREVILALPTSRDGLAPSVVSRDLQQIEEKVGALVVVVREHLPSWERTRYVAAGIPFVVPGEQLFLPMLLVDLREVKRRPVQKGKPLDSLSWPTQVVVLRHLLRGDVERASLKEIAELLGYSRMTLTKVQRELEAHDLCRVETAARTKQLTFQLNPAELWRKTRTLSRSPIRKHALLVRCDLDLPIAGLTALAAATDIADDPRQTVAVSALRLDDFTKRKLILETPDPDAATTHLEVWNYDPMLLSRDGAVDPLSLFLSLQDIPDERVQAALATMLEALPWSTG